MQRFAIAPGLATRRSRPRGQIVQREKYLLSRGDRRSEPDDHARIGQRNQFAAIDSECGYAAKARIGRVKPP